MGVYKEEGVPLKRRQEDNPNLQGRETPAFQN
jgi:hypothetical protein